MKFEKILIVDKKFENYRLDVFIFEALDSLFSRSEIKNFINSKMICINGHHLKPSYRILENQKICIKVDSHPVDSILPEKIPIKILYEDSSILVVNKEPGMVVHPGAGNKTGTLANALAYYLKDSTVLERMGIVHRLDKNTSGIMLIAKNKNSHKILSQQFKDRQVKKIYKAIVWGKTNRVGDIRLSIARDKYNRIKFKSGSSGKESYTSYKTISYLDPLSYLELYPLTGRTHQIRVHLSSIGKPIFGDDLYGGGKNHIRSFHSKFNAKINFIFSFFSRFALHAYRIDFIHPDTNKKIKFTCPVPEDINNIIEELRK